MKVVASSLFVTAIAHSCKGSDDLVVTAAVCYHGSAEAWGLTENVGVKITDFASGAGHIDVTGGGLQSFICTNKAMTKSGQDITSDLSDCVPSDITITSLQYCSDDDTFAVTVEPKEVPIPINATLNQVDCASTQESGTTSTTTVASCPLGSNIGKYGCGGPFGACERRGRALCTANYECHCKPGYCATWYHQCQEATIAGITLSSEPETMSPIFEANSGWKAKVGTVASISIACMAFAAVSVQFLRYSRYRALASNPELRVAIVASEVNDA